FGAWAPPAVELPLETRAQASVESSQDEPLFEEVFEEELPRTPPSPAGTASFSFQAAEDDDAGTRAFTAPEFPAPRTTAPIPPPRAASPPPAPSNPGPSHVSSPKWSVNAPPAPTPPPAP